MTVYKKFFILTVSKISNYGRSITDASVDRVFTSANNNSLPHWLRWMKLEKILGVVMLWK